MSKTKYGIGGILIAVIIGFVGGVFLENPQLLERLDNKQQHQYDNTILVKPNEVSLCFTPPAGCGEQIGRLIDQAESSIYVQAYGITSNAIANRLVAAHNRGLRVSVLLDKSNLTDKYSQISRLRKSGIDVSIDRVPGIAHNKVMIIDEKIVITGSFNFTNAADKRNAENVIIINNASIAKQYLQNWLSRKEANQ